MLDTFLPRLRALLLQESKQLGQVLPILYSAMMSKGSDKFDIHSLPFELVVLEFCLDTVSQNFQSQLQNLVQSITDVLYQIRLQVTYKVLEKLGLLKVQLNRISDKVGTVQELLQQINDADSELENFFLKKGVCLDQLSEEHENPFMDHKHYTQVQLEQLEQQSQHTNGADQRAPEELQEARGELQPAPRGLGRTGSILSDGDQEEQAPDESLLSGDQRQQQPSPFQGQEQSQIDGSQQEGSVASTADPIFQLETQDEQQQLPQQDQQQQSPQHQQQATQQRTLQEQEGQQQRDEDQQQQNLPQSPDSSWGEDSTSHRRKSDVSRDDIIENAMQFYPANSPEKQGLTSSPQQTHFEEQLVQQFGPAQQTLEPVMEEEETQEDATYDQKRQQMYVSDPQKIDIEQIKEEGAFEVEVLVEAYMLLVNSSVSRLEDLREYIEDTEESVELTISTQRNNLVEIRLMLVVLIACLNLPFSVHGFFAMNFPNSRIANTELFSDYLIITLSQTLAPVLLFIIYLVFAWRFNFLTFMTNRQGSIVALKRDIAAKQLPSYFNRPLNYFTEQNVAQEPEQLEDKENY